MIIFNPMGAVFVVIGFVALFAGAMIHPVLGCVFFGLVGGGADFMYRRSHKPGTFDHALFSPRAGGHVFFLPIWIWGALAVPLGLVVGIGAALGPGLGSSPYAEQISHDERELDRNVFSGEVEFAENLRAMLQVVAVKEAKMERAHIRAVVNGDRVLVLIKLDQLRKFSGNARRDLLEFVSGMASSAYPEKKIYIGMKNFLYGATLSPEFGYQTGTRTERDLDGFYAPLPPTVPVASGSPAGTSASGTTAVGGTAPAPAATSAPAATKP